MNMCQQVNLTKAIVVSPGVPSNDVSSLLGLVSSLLCAWMAANAPSYTSLCSSDVLRSTSWTSKIQYGQTNVKNSLTEEWDFFERKYSSGGAEPLAGRIDVHHVELSKIQRCAIANIWLDLWTGSTWPYRITGTMLQVFTNPDGKGWKLAAQGDSWWSSWDPATRSVSKVGVGTWRHDFTYPAANLSRAASWYRALFGTPEVDAPTQVAFRLGGPRLVLTTNNLNGFMKVRKNLPNGYSTFYTANLTAEVQHVLSRAPAAKLLKSVPAGGSSTPDAYAVMADPAGNVFVFKQRRYSVDSSLPPPSLTSVNVTLLGPSVPTNVVDVVKALLTAWLQRDEAALSSLLDPASCTWHDDTRLKDRPHATGRTAVLQYIRDSWLQYDRSARGISAALSVTSLRAVSLGSDLVVVAFDRVLSSSSGPPDHWFRQPAHHLHVFRTLPASSPSGRPSLQLLHTFICEDISTPEVKGRAGRSLDYVAYPTPMISLLEPFYTTAMHMGSPYKDELWRGWWSQVSVFGIYETEVKVDGIPQPNLANGYASLWVTSPASLYKQLKAQGSPFFKIPAINDKVGLDDQGDYTTMLTADSEGNALVFSGYDL